MFQTDITQTGWWKGLRNPEAIQVNDLILQNDTIDWTEDEEQSTGVHIFWMYLWNLPLEKTSARLYLILLMLLLLSFYP